MSSIYTVNEVRSALQNAASVATLPITTEAGTTEALKKSALASAAPMAEVDL